MDDARAVYEVMARQERHDLGKVEIEPADIVGDWQKPSFDIGASTVGVFDGAALIAYAEVNQSGRGDAAVDPSYRRRGLGTTLAAWMRARTGELGGTVIGTPVPEGSPRRPAPGEARLADPLDQLGAQPSRGRADRRSGRLPMRLCRSARPRPRSTPRPTSVIEDAFLEWSVRDREPYDDFLATTVRRPGFEPWHFRVVTDASGRLVGTALVQVYGEPPIEAFISRLAVRRDQRHRGLAQALLVDAFARGRERGAVRSALSTDSRTGALGLYQKVGMEVGDVWVNRFSEV